MSYKYVLYEKKDRIAYITINRPEVMNAIHPPASQELCHVWADFRDDPEVWVAILTGAGDKAFSAGNDLKYHTAHSEEVWASLSTPGGFGGITNRFECNKPMIAAINGIALGGGFEMALACDIIIAADHAHLGLPEPTVGLMAAGGGVHRLPRQIPLKIAIGMILTGKPITAQEAHRVGLANEVVPLKDLMATAEKWAHDIVRCSPLAIKASKEAAMKGLGLSLEAALATVFDAYRMLEQSEDFIEGPNAFAEKRPPQWKGR